MSCGHPAMLKEMTDLIQVQETLIGELKKENQVNSALYQTASFNISLVIVFVGFIFSKMNQTIKRKKQIIREKNKQLAALRKAADPQGNFSATDLLRSWTDDDLD